MADIEYERDGVKKMAGERFKEQLKAVGWTVVEKPKKPEKVKKDADSKKHN